MATRLYGFSPGSALVTETAGSAVVADKVELTVELATTAVNDQGTTRAISKNEVLLCLERLRNHIIKGNWPPA